MRKAVYFAIVLRFARKLLGKVCSPGVVAGFRVRPRLRPGEPGYHPELDEPEDRILHVYGCGIHRYLMGTRRDDLSFRQWKKLEYELSVRYDRRLSDAAGGRMTLTSFWLESPYPPLDEGELPPGVAGILREIEAFVRGAKP